MAANGTVAYLTKIPNCDVNPEHGKAYADASILIEGRRTWAYVCATCFGKYDGHLGLGAGQELRLESERPVPSA